MGRIVEVGRASGSAREVVDAGGLALSPGIVDIHTHYDAQLTWDSRCSPSPALGVTTVVIGNCGFGLTPNRPDIRDTLMENLSEVEGMSLAALRAGIDWRFEDFADYLDLIATRGVVPNVAAFACHSSLRVAVLGADASSRAATAEEMAEMARLLRDSLEAGAIGFSSSTFENHNGFGGVPMPSRLAEDTEFERLIDVLGEAGQGVFMITAGERTTVKTLTQYAARSGRPMVYAALLHDDQVPNRSHDVLNGCRAAQRNGNAVYAQVSCQPITMAFTLQSAYPFYAIGAWGSLAGQDHQAMVRAFMDTAFRDAVRNDLKAPVSGRVFNGDWRIVEVTECPSHPEYDGRSLVEIANAAGADPLDLLLDIALADELRTLFNAKLLNTSEDTVDKMLHHPDSLISLSDGGAHLTFLCDAGFGLHLLGHWVRERKSFELGAAVREITSRPAEVYGIRDRGVLAEGAWADLMLFDPDMVGISKPERVDDLPAGESRLIRRATGLHGVWVNGAMVHDGTEYRDHARPPGQVLTEFAR